MKCVMVLDRDLPPGTCANTAAALGISLGNHIQGLIGPDTTDRCGIRHMGITAVPVPILSAGRDELKRIYEKGRTEASGLTVIGFSSIAQRCHSYPDYLSAMADRPTEDIAFLGLCIYGPRGGVNSLCGQLKLLK